MAFHVPHFESHNPKTYAYEAGKQGGLLPPPNNFYRAKVKLGKFLSNYTKIWAIFAEISEKMGNLN